MSEWENRELKIEHHKGQIAQLARDTLGQVRTVMLAVSGEDGDRNWRTYLAAMERLCGQELRGE